MPRPDSATRKPPSARGSSSRRTAERTASQSSIVVAGSDRTASSSSSSPQPTRNSAWLVRPSGARPAAVVASLQGREVDVGGQVLAPDPDRPVVVDPVPGIGAQGSVGALRPVQLGRREAVVEDQDDPAFEAGRGLADPVVERQADLAPGALLELDAVGGQARRQGRRRRRALELDEAVVVPVDEQLADPARPADEEMDGQGVEELVGHDHPGPGRLVRQSELEGPAEPGRGDVPHELVQPVRVDLDRDVADRPREVRRARHRAEPALAGQRAEDRQAEGARSRTVLPDDEPSRRPEPAVDLVELAGDRPPRRSGGCPPRSGSRRPGPAARPRPGSSRAPARRGHAP